MIGAKRRIETSELRLIETSEHQNQVPAQSLSRLLAASKQIYEMDTKERNLKWNTFPDHLVGVFKDLGKTGQFAYVTLISDDQIPTLAHKAVLSACSPVFRTLLVNNTHSHPLIYLRGIKQTELQAILKFMYFGETQLFENRMDEFLSVATDLKVKDPKLYSNSFQQTLGENLFLKDVDQDLEKSEKKQTSTNKEMFQTKGKDNQSNSNEANIGGDFKCDEFEASYNSAWKLEKHKKESEEKIADDVLRKKHSFKSLFKAKNGKNKVVKRVRIKGELLKLPRMEDRLSCDLCEATYENIDNLNNHKRSKHEGRKIICEECNGLFATHGSLKQHKQLKHTFDGLKRKGKWKCDQCDAAYGNSNNLNAHKRSKHEGHRFFCDMCHNKYTHPNTLKLHKQSQHGIKDGC